MTPNFKKTVSGNRFQELREELEEVFRYEERYRETGYIHPDVEDWEEAVWRNRFTILAALSIAERGQWVKTSGAWGYFYNCCSDHRVLAVFDTEELASKSHKEDCKPWDDKSPVFFIAEPLPPEEK